MPAIIVIDPEGRRTPLAVADGVPLMEALRDEGAVDAVCGGGTSCGTCAVRIEAPWCHTLAAPGADEGLLLEGLEAVVGSGAGLRLSCRITCSDALDGMVLHLLPAG